MATRLPEREAGMLVTVRLSDVPAEKRLAEADRLIAREGLRGYEALELYLAAQSPRSDPALLVPFAKARRVLGWGRA